MGPPRCKPLHGDCTAGTGGTAKFLLKRSGSYQCPGVPGHEGECGEMRCRAHCRCAREGWIVGHRSGGHSQFKAESQEPGDSSSAPSHTRQSTESPEPGTLGEAAMQGSRTIDDELSIVTVNVDGYMGSSALTGRTDGADPDKGA